MSTLSTNSSSSQTSPKSETSQSYSNETIRFEASLGALVSNVSAAAQEIMKNTNGLIVESVTEAPTAASNSDADQPEADEEEPAEAAAEEDFDEYFKESEEKKILSEMEIKTRADNSDQVAAPPASVAEVAATAASEPRSFIMNLINSNGNVSSGLMALTDEEIETLKLVSKLQAYNESLTKGRTSTMTSSVSSEAVSNGSTGSKLKVPSFWANIGKKNAS
jgi:hypothetical protein